MRLFPLIAFLAVFSPLPLFAQGQPAMPTDLSRFSAQDAAKWNALVAGASGEDRKKLEELERQIRKESPAAAKLLDAAR